MSHRMTRVLARAMDSSATVRVVRPIIAGSLSCAIVAAVAASVSQSRGRIARGLPGKWSIDDEMRSAGRIDTLVAESRIMSTLNSWSLAPSLARREARTNRLLEPILSLDLPARLRVGGGVIVVAVLTHTILLAVLERPVQVVGWSVRTGLVAAGLALLYRPEALAAAWRDKAVSPTPKA
jgi:hypothetical protein